MKKITLEEYIRNPSGGRILSTFQRDALQQEYNKKFDNLMLKVAGKINYTMFKNHDGSRFILYLAIPSESEKALFYDTVLDFYTTDDVAKRTTNLDEYNIRFFSNDPNFMFTYANVFNKDGLLVPELRNKFDKIVYKQKPVKTNPNRIVGYVKSLYFAYLFYKLKGFRNKLLWQMAFPFHKSDLDRLVMRGQDKLAQAQSLKTYNKKSKYGDTYLSKLDLTDKNVLQRKARELGVKAKDIKTVEKVYASNVKLSKKVDRSGHKVKSVKIIRPHR